MSRGHGAVQRWLLSVLPETRQDTGEKQSAQDQASTAVDQLAARYFRTRAPSLAQRSSVRRALATLEAEGRVAAVREVVAGRGRPWYWRQVNPEERNVAMEAGPHVPD